MEGGQWGGGATANGGSAQLIAEDVGARSQHRPEEPVLACSWFQHRLFHGGAATSGDVGDGRGVCLNGTHGTNGPYGTMTKNSNAESQRRGDAETEPEQRLAPLRPCVCVLISDAPRIGTIRFIGGLRWLKQCPAPLHLCVSASLRLCVEKLF